MAPLLSRLYSALNSRDSEEDDGESSDETSPPESKESPAEGATESEHPQEQEAPDEMESEDSQPDKGPSQGDETTTTESEHPESTEDDDDGDTDDDSGGGEELTEDELRERVTELESENEELRAEVESLRDETEKLTETITQLKEKKTDLEEENGQLRSALQREKKELEEFKERSKKREEQAKEDAIRGIVEDMTDVRDTLKRALQQDEDIEIREGVEVTLRNFDRIMQEYDIEVIEPEPGTEPDAQRHEVMMKAESNEIAEGHITEVFSAGYEREERVFRPAQVVISSGPPEDEDGDDGADTDEISPNEADEIPSANSETPDDESDGINDSMFDPVETDDSEDDAEEEFL